MEENLQTKLKVKLFAFDSYDEEVEDEDEGIFTCDKKEFINLGSVKTRYTAPDSNINSTNVQPALDEIAKLDAKIKAIKMAAKVHVLLSKKSVVFLTPPNCCVPPPPKVDAKPPPLGF